LVGGGAGLSLWFDLVAEGAEFIVASATGCVTWHAARPDSATQFAMSLKRGVIYFEDFFGEGRGAA